ncbi:hypothetical protein ACRE_050870 [Hapsidospora chrysogenum ATCC 11550]|uniref:Uncharacterized protein n=1 Tax=Hapsidospora chrysogenum (strain ATCC 11550 / CBS 779.69 / DSM 880 / IAM 14645 / JCM 23072 / IMI 49137) TaxID=857340 RepID=A0A086T456_HAPC1|nr:hypothetical protein ACRE_050870 [Hapsidospora chrysogenum ATCC 11550]
MLSALEFAFAMEVMRADWGGSWSPSPQDGLPVPLTMVIRGDDGDVVVVIGTSSEFGFAGGAC